MPSVPDSLVVDLLSAVPGVISGSDGASLLPPLMGENGPELDVETLGDISLAHTAHLLDLAAGRDAAGHGEEGGEGGSDDEEEDGEEAYIAGLEAENAELVRELEATYADAWLRTETLLSVCRALEQAVPDGPGVRGERGELDVYLGHRDAIAAAHPGAPPLAPSDAPPTGDEVLRSARLGAAERNLESLREYMVMLARRVAEWRAARRELAERDPPVDERVAWIREHGVTAHPFGFDHLARRISAALNMEAGILLPGTRPPAPGEK